MRGLLRETAACGASDLRQEFVIEVHADLADHGAPQGIIELRVGEPRRAHADGINLDTELGGKLCGLLGQY